MRADLLSFGMFGLAGVAMGRAWVFSLTAFVRATIQIEARVYGPSQLDTWVRMRYRALDLFLKMSMAILLFVVLAGVPMGLLAIIEGSDRGNRPRLYVSYVVCLIVSMGSSLPHLIRWSREYRRDRVRQCSHCGKRNELPRFPGQQGLGHFARLAVSNAEGFECWRCGRALDFALANECKKR